MSIELDRELRFGTNLFINAEDSPDFLRTRVETLHRAGFTLIRLFLAWDLIETSPGIFNWSPYDEIFDEAHRWGVKIIGTLMSNSPPGWMDQTCGQMETGNLEDPQFFAVSLDHVRKVVGRFKDSPALDSWILWNEPARSPSPQNPHVRQLFQSYMEDFYKGNIAAYNADHFRPVPSFKEIEITGSNLRQAGFISHRSKVEWLSFSVANLQRMLAGLAAEVRKLDSRHPIHVNPHRISQCLADGGQSIWQEADLVDFMGCSSHPSWHSIRFPRHRFPASLAMFGDLMRSATRAQDDYFWVTELQGGVTLLSSFQPLTTTPAEARLWLWECIGTGAKAVVYWCANARTDGYEAGEWDLLDVNGQPSPQLEVISETIGQLRAHRDLLKEARPPLPDVGILVSEESQILDLVEGDGPAPENPRNTQRGSDAVAGAYLLAADLSLEVRFYDLPRLIKTPPEQLPRVLLAPSLTVITPAAINHLRAAVAAGATLIADGFFSWKDAFGRLARSTWSEADSLFGMEFLGYEAIAEDSFPIGNRVSLPGSFVRARLRIAGAQVAAQWKDGSPALSLHKIGKGTAYRIGTQVFQPYLRTADPNARHWISELVAPHLASGLRILNPVPGMRLRRLQYKNREIGLLINSTETQQKVEVQVQAKTQNYIVPAQDAILILP